MKLHFSTPTEETLWNNAVWGLGIVSKTGRFLKVNPALCGILEYTESELLTKTFQDITHPDDLYDDVAMSEKVESGESPYYVMSKRYITKTNSVIWTKLRVDRVESDDGTFCHFLSQISVCLTLEEDRQKPTPQIKKGGFWAYVRANLKWIIPMVVGGIISLFVFFSELHHEWEVMKEKIEAFYEQHDEDSKPPPE